MASGRMMTWLIYSLAFTPHVVVTITSFLQWRVGTVTAIPTLANFAMLFDQEMNAVWVSLSTASAATFLCLIFGLSIAYIIVRKRYRVMGPSLNTLVMAPHIIPGTVFAIGFILMFNAPPLVLTGTWTILALSYFLRMMPFALKTSESALYQIHPPMEEAVISLGAKPIRVFIQIVVPMTLSGVVTGLTLVFLHSVTELSTTILHYRPPWTPMSAVISQNTISPGADVGAAAMAVVMMLIIYAPLTVITIKQKSVTP